MAEGEQVVILTVPNVPGELLSLAHACTSNWGKDRQLRQGKDIGLCFCLALFLFLECVICLLIFPFILVGQSVTGTEVATAWAWSHPQSLHCAGTNSRNFTPWHRFHIEVISAYFIDREIRCKCANFRTLIR